MTALNEFDLLLVIAQLSVAFAGFASLASVLNPGKAQDDARVDAGRLMNMLLVSLCTTILALVPFIPGLFRWTVSLAWRSSAVAALATMLLVAPGALMRGERMRRYAGFNRVVNTVNLALSVTAAAAFILCALGLPTRSPAASYVTGLIALMAICALLFFRVIASLLRPHQPE
jgi:hypothetical protein